MQVQVPYSISRQDVPGKIDGLIPALSEEYKGKVVNPNTKWNGPKSRMDFSFKYKAMPFVEPTITGYVEIRDSNVLVDITLPAIAQGYSDQITQAVRGRLSSLLSDGKGSARAYA